MQNDHQLHAHCQLLTTHHIPVSASYEASLHASPDQHALCSNSHTYKLQINAKPSWLHYDDKFSEHDKHLKVSSTVAQWDGHQTDDQKITGSTSIILWLGICS